VDSVAKETVNPLVSLLYFGIAIVIFVSLAATASIIALLQSRKALAFARSIVAVAPNPFTSPSISSIQSTYPPSINPPQASTSPPPSSTPTPTPSAPKDPDHYYCYHGWDFTTNGQCLQCVAEFHGSHVPGEFIRLDKKPD
jgi:hypothetical protein